MKYLAALLKNITKDALPTGRKNIGKNLTIRTRILGLFLAIITTAIAIVAGTTYHIGKNTLESATKTQLGSSVRFVINQISLLSGAYTSRQFSDKLGYVLAEEQASFREMGYDAVIYLFKPSGFIVDPGNVNAETDTRTDLPDDFVAEALKNKRGSADRVIQGMPKTIVYGYVLEKDWIYAVAVSKASYLKMIYRLQLVTLLSGLFSVFLAFIFSLIGTGGIIGTIKAMNKTVSDADTGDLTVRTKAGRGGPELRALAQNFNAMLSSFQIAVKEIGASIEELTEASQDLSHIAQKTNDSTSCIHAITRQMAESAVQQEDFLVKLRSSTGRIIDIIRNITAQVDDAAKASDMMMETVREGLHAIRALENKIVSIEKFSENTVGHIQVLEARTRQISKIMDTLKRISAQTRLLSFNASIEAAKAGAFGAGFSVVAVEIQKLAQISAQSAFEVSELISEIHKDTEAVADSANLGMAISREGTEIARNTDSAFNRILDKVSETHDHIYLISGNTETISDNVKTFTECIESISRMVTDTTGSCQEVAATMEDHHHLSSGITDSAGKLQQVAQKLHALKSKYTT